MKYEASFHIALGIVAGLLIYPIILGTVGEQKVSHGKHGHDHNDMTMHEMNHALEGKTGDAFDKDFLSGMIIHHAGAIEMAEKAEAQAGHVEIKNMAKEIITAQDKEIMQMKEWQKNWGY